MPDQLSDQAKALFDGKNYVTVATVQPDGSPQLSVVWAKTDGGDILVSTLEGRRKHLNLLKDPRVTLLLNPADNPFAYVEVRGTATLDTEGGRELINELSWKYNGKEYPAEPPEAVRTVVRVTPRRIVERGL
ncbi:PPOX class F420-dependent oxidoreductase [Streptacidiphilus sp. N1-12]|uniref:PPOX class F420-dependent oxidoreductase n=2 Tax=Streptacidiphilus alkalitolerans TaxID=3342712 RepID=A0ABV6WBW6_9ACTN